MDLVLHADRLDGRAKRTYEARLGELPDGVIVERGGAAFLVAGGALRAWTAARLRRRGAGRLADGRVRVLTPAVTVATIAARLRGLRCTRPRPDLSTSSGVPITCEVGGHC